MHQNKQNSVYSSLFTFGQVSIDIFILWQLAFAIARTCGHWLLGVENRKKEG